MSDTGLMVQGMVTPPSCYDIAMPIAGTTATFPTPAEFASVAELARSTLERQHRQCAYGRADPSA
jgi:hypothetical protein